VVARPGYRIAEAPQRVPTLAGRMVRLPVDSSRHDPSIILLDAPTSDVSSTAIRERRLKGESIAGLVPDSVRQHIEQHELYSSTTPERRESDASPAPAAGRLHG
jgi:nicotinic acid mononucleotide adenylyltransferase